MKGSLLCCYNNKFLEHRPSSTENLRTFSKRMKVDEPKALSDQVCTALNLETVRQEMSLLLLNLRAIKDTRDSDGLSQLTESSLDWCKINNLALNIKTKEIVVDFRRDQSSHAPFPNDTAVEIVSSTKFLGYK